MIKGVTKTIQNQAREQSLLGKTLTDEGVIRAGAGAVATSQAGGLNRIGLDF